MCPQVMSETGEGPNSPWISFSVLFGVIQGNISSVAKELLFHHYEELKVLSINMIYLWVLIVVSMLDAEQFQLFYLTGKHNFS
jgi:hypothetical protein